VWELVCRDKLRIGELDSISIDEVEKANAALDTWTAAQIRANRK